MSTDAARTLAAPMPLGIQLVAPTPGVAGSSAASWWRTVRIVGKVIAACGAALAAGFAISLGVTAAFLLIAVAVS